MCILQRASCKTAALFLKGRKVKEYITRRDLFLYHPATIETPWARLGVVSCASESLPAISDRQLLGWVKLSLEVGRSKHSPFKLRN